MKLYHYDHCPFCIRVRLIIGWKNLPVEQVILANADEQRHFELIGEKIVPILEKDDGSRMKESLDIVAYLDNKYGDPLLCGRPEDDQYQKLGYFLEQATSIARYLVHPRNIQVFAEDFPTQADRDYYEAKKSQSIGPFPQALADSQTYIPLMAQQLDHLKPLLREDKLGTSPSYASLILFPLLRSLSHVKGLLFPTEAWTYMEKVSNATQVPLLFDRAI